MRTMYSRGLAWVGLVALMCAIGVAQAIASVSPFEWSAELLRFGQASFWPAILPIAAILVVTAVFVPLALGMAENPWREWIHFAISAGVAAATLAAIVCFVIAVCVQTLMLYWLALSVLWGVVLLRICAFNPDGD